MPPHAVLWCLDVSRNTDTVSWRPSNRSLSFIARLRPDDERSQISSVTSLLETLCSARFRLDNLAAVVSTVYAVRLLAVVNWWQDRGRGHGHGHGGRAHLVTLDRVAPEVAVVAGGGGGGGGSGSNSGGANGGRG